MWLWLCGFALDFHAPGFDSRSDHMTGLDSRIIGGPVWHVLWQICMCAAMAADKYSPRRGPEMDEKRANEKGLSEERIESSPEVDKSAI